MRRVSVVRYYWFGTCLRFLQDAKEGHPIHKSTFIAENLSFFFSYLDELSLVVTQRAARDLQAFRETLAEFPKDARLTDEQATRLRELVSALRKTLDAELEGLEAFLVTPKRFDTHKLMSNVASLFAPAVYARLPDIARHDFDEAGKCIAFERPTAAAFHILRGTEAVLRFFYLTMIRRNRITALTWGPIINDLRSHKKTRPHETLYSNLDNIRKSYRNPTQHPDMTYDIHEVQDLFPLCIEAVNRMIKLLPKEQ